MLAVALFCIACAAYWWWRWKHTKTTEPPYLPGAWPIVGHTPMLLGKACHVYNQIIKIGKLNSEMGGVGVLRMGPQNVYIVSDPVDSHTVMSSCFEKDRYTSFAKPWLGDGLLTADYHTWKDHRKLLNPAFNQSLLDTFMCVFNSQSEKLVNDLEKEVGKGLFDHWKYTRLNALESICLTSLGVDFTDSNLNSEYVETLEKIFNVYLERAIKIWWHSPYTFAWSRLKKEQDDCLKILHNMSDTVTRNRKEKYNGNTQAEASEPETKFKPFIDLILELSAAKGVFTDKQIREHVDTILVAGHDTTSNVLMFTMILLGSHPKAQDKVFAEIQKTLGGDRYVEKADLSKLVYLEAVLRESMRIWPVALILARTIVRDIKLSNYTLSAGQTCFIVTNELHMHPNWGPDAHEFKPERWLEPDKLPDSYYAAFGMGKRQCIGKVYAMMSMKTTLAHVLRRYRLKADHTKVRLKYDSMLKADAGHCISLEKRHGI